MAGIILLSFQFWLIVIAVLFCIGLLSSIAKHERKETYEDDFGNSFEHISTFNKGIFIGNGRITREKSFLHCALISQSGGGKTSGCLIPTALNIDDCSVIILDPARELFEKTSGSFIEKGYKIKVLDFFDVTRSIGFNPLLRATTNTELNMLAEMIFAPTMRNSKDIFWPMFGAKLLTLIFKIQKLLPPEYQNLANTLYLINILKGSRKKLDTLVVKIADNKLFEEYKGIISHDTKLLSNIIATAQSALRIFDDEMVSKVTSVDTLNMTEFRKDKTVLYLQFNVMDARYYSFLIEIFFSQIFKQFMTKIPSDNELDVFMLCDEMGSITIKGFAEALSNLRKFRVSVCYAIQSRSQLTERYGRDDAHTILANSYHKLIFPGMETDMAKELEIRMGRWTFEREDGSTGTREIMTTSELIHVEEGYAMYSAGPIRPMKVKLLPYYSQHSMNAKSSISPPTVIGDVPETIQYIEIEKFLKPQPADA